MGDHKSYLYLGVVNWRRLLLIGCFGCCLSDLCACGLLWRCMVFVHGSDLVCMCLFLESVVVVMHCVVLGIFPTKSLMGYQNM